MGLKSLQFELFDNKELLEPILGDYKNTGLSFIFCKFDIN